MIDKKFREADLEIAFPQVDLHVRDVPKELQASVPEPQASSRANGSAQQELGDVKSSK